jgi:exopolysaccharide production protein ExoZ
VSAVTAEANAAAGNRSTVVTIQYLRAIAASIVVYHHAFAPPALSVYYPSALGQFGVDIFFVISGYIMWTTTVGSGRGPASFWAARIVRVVPLYWFYTTLFLIAAVAVTGQTEDLGLDYVLKSYLFVPTINSQTLFIVPVYSLGWTLNFEMFFYLLFGLSLLLTGPAVRYFCLAVLFGALISAGHFLQPQQPIAITYTSPMLFDFLAGVTLAALRPVLARCPVQYGVAAVLLSFVTLYFALPIDPLRNIPVGYGVPAILLVGGAVVLERIVHRRPNSIGLLLGNASYSMYLAHPFAQRLWYLVLFHYIPMVSSASRALVFVGGGVLVGILAGVVSWFVLERPLLAVGHRLIRRRGTADLDLTSNRDDAQRVGSG